MFRLTILQVARLSQLFHWRMAAVYITTKKLPSHSVVVLGQVSFSALRVSHSETAAWGSSVGGEHGSSACRPRPWRRKHWVKQLRMSRLCSRACRRPQFTALEPGRFRRRLFQSTMAHQRVWRLVSVRVIEEVSGLSC